MKNHPFHDGNKRTGYTLMRLHLLNNGLDINAKEDDKYDLVISLASGRIGFDSDIITSLDELSQINKEFELRTKWFNPVEILNQATSKSAELLQLSGERNPYPEKIGVIEEGAYADLLLINGNPLDDITILQDAETNLALIMKDGKIYKNIIK